MSKALHEIIAIKEGLEAQLLAQPGVTGVDVGYKYVGGQRTDEVAIRVMVAKKQAAVADQQKVPEMFDGVKTDVIERTYFLHEGVSNKKKVDDITLQADTGNYNPVKGGISIGPCRAVGGFVYVGTLGAIVKDNATGQPMLLSNFHVMCIDNGWHVGDTMAQPGRVDGGTCPANVVGTLQRAVLSNLVDGAVSSLSGRGYSCEIVGIGKVAGTAVATLGMPVRKRGRTTGLTYGFVDSVSLSVNIDYGPGIGVKTLTNQIGIRPDTAHNAAFGDHGDSGSAVVDGGVHVVGLHFAGSSDGHGIANQIANVLSALKVSLCVGTKVLLKDGIKDKDFKDGIKDLKDGHKELKDNIKEIKDGHKELEKTPFDHGPGKGPVENGPGLPGNPIGPGPLQAKTKDMLKPETKDKGESKDKLESKENKDHKDQGDTKQHKDAKDFKDNPDTKQHKDQKDSKDAPDNKVHKDNKDHKDQKEHKEVKDHSKPETKDHKPEIKDHKPEIKESGKPEFDKPPQTENFTPKLVADTGPLFPNDPLQPAFPGAGMEQRLAQLEATVASLSTFITAEMRPDLASGALTNESDGGCKNC